jgi:hypothetical protein
VEFQLRGRHPFERMGERHVSREQISYALENYTITVPGNKNSTGLVSRPFPDGRILKVWFVGAPPPRDGVIIKSVAWKERM